MVPDNGSGYGRGQYADPAQVKTYLDAMEGYLRRRNAEWLDRNTDARTGEVREGVKELCNLWQADSHLVKWAIGRGMLDPASIKPDGLQNRQIGRLSAIVYFRDEQHHRAIAMELASYLDRKEREQLQAIEDLSGRWAVAPKDCVHDWEELWAGGRRCLLCGGEWRPFR